MEYLTGKAPRLHERAWLTCTDTHMNRVYGALDTSVAVNASHILKKVNFSSHYLLNVKPGNLYYYMDF